MAALIRVPVTDPQNVLDTYGAGALIRLERSTSATMSGASEITTIAVVAGTREYEYRDQAGTPGTDFYWYRLSKASPATADDYSSYSAIVLAGALSGEVITVEAARDWMGIASSDTDDDAWLPVAVGAVNRAFIRAVGVDFGPSPDTTRTYDGCRATRSGRRLWIPGGIRAFLTVAVSTDGGTNWTTVTNDVRIGPASHSRPSGEPGAYIEFKDPAAITGSFSYFPDGTDNVRITATAFSGFGWDAYPYDAVQACQAALQRLYADRQGRGGFPTETDAARYLNPRTVAYFRDMYFAPVA